MTSVPHALHNLSELLADCDGGSSVGSSIRLLADAAGAADLTNLESFREHLTVAAVRSLLPMALFAAARAVRSDSDAVSLQIAGSACAAAFTIKTARMAVQQALAAAGAARTDVDGPTGNAELACSSMALGLERPQLEGIEHLVAVTARACGAAANCADQALAAVAAAVTQAVAMCTERPELQFARPRHEVLLAA